MQMEGYSKDHRSDQQDHHLVRWFVKTLLMHLSGVQLNFLFAVVCKGTEDRPAEKVVEANERVYPDVVFQAASVKEILLSNDTPAPPPPPRAFSEEDAIAMAMQDASLDRRPAPRAPQPPSSFAAAVASGRSEPYRPQAGGVPRSASGPYSGSGFGRGGHGHGPSRPVHDGPRGPAGTGDALKGAREIGRQHGAVRPQQEYDFEAANATFEAERAAHKGGDEGELEPEL